MHLSVYEQGEIFYFSFVFGLFVGIYYDVYRFLRYLGFTSKKAVLIEDICFMCTSAVAVFLFSQTVVNGHLRMYVLAAVFFGAVSYRYSLGLLSGFIFKILHIILKYIKQIFTHIFSFLNRQYYRSAKVMSAQYSKLCGFISNKAKNREKVDIN